MSEVQLEMQLTESQKNAKRQKALRAARVQAGLKQINFYLSLETIAKIDKLKIANGLTRDEIVTLALKSYRFTKPKPKARRAPAKKVTK